MDIKIIEGERRNSVKSTLTDFEGLSSNNWKAIQQRNCIADGFLFLVGTAKYPKRCLIANLRYGKNHVFVQNMLPHGKNNIYKSRGYGRIYALYEPAKLNADDIVLEESSIYQALPNGRIKLILTDGEHRDPMCVAKMFDYIIDYRSLQNFAPENALPKLYEVTFTKKSCGYFLKEETYLVWATPIGIPDTQTGEIVKSWLFCDVNCGIPAIINAEREEFHPIASQEGAKVGLFTVRDGKLVFEW